MGCCQTLKEGGQSENFAENQPDTIRPLTLTHRRYIAPGRTRLQGGGGRSQSPRKKLSPHIGSRAFIIVVLLLMAENGGGG